MNFTVSQRFVHNDQPASSSTASLRVCHFIRYAVCLSRSAAARGWVFIFPAKNESARSGLVAIVIAEREKHAKRSAAAVLFAV